jgi:hypothetical protein
MKTLSFPGIVSVSKTAIRLVINSFLLGPLAVIYALIAEALLTAHQSVLGGQTEFALLAILVGGFFCSFACIAASVVVLLPIAFYELHQQNRQTNCIDFFKKYLLIPVLLSVVVGLVIWIAAGLKPVSTEALSIVISIYLTASTGLYLMGRQLSSNF